MNKHIKLRKQKVRKKKQIIISLLFEKIEKKIFMKK
jgi:hypothetical protein